MPRIKHRATSLRSPVTAAPGPRTALFMGRILNHLTEVYEWTRLAAALVSLLKDWETQRST